MAWEGALVDAWAEENKVVVERAAAAAAVTALPAVLGDRRRRATAGVGPGDALKRQTELLKGHAILGRIRGDLIDKDLVQLDREGASGKRDLRRVDCGGIRGDEGDGRAMHVGVAADLDIGNRRGSGSGSSSAMGGRRIAHLLGERADLRAGHHVAQVQGANDREWRHGSSGGACRTLRTSCAGGPLQTLWTLRSHRTGHALESRCPWSPGDALWALDALDTLGTRCPRRTRWPLRASRASLSYSR